MPKGKQDLTVAEKLRAEAQEVEQRQRQEAETRLKEVDEQIGPLASEKTDLEGFLGKEKEKESTPAPAPQPKAVKARRSRKGGTRMEQAVKLLSENPQGLTASEVAKALKIKPNYMYRVLSEAVEDGKIKREGQQYQTA